MSFFIPVLLGTAREGRLSEKVAAVAIKEIRAYGFDTELVDVRDHLLGATIPWWVTDQKTTPWRNIMARADGLVIVSPEYNHGYPGELKMLLDSAKDEYLHKPVAMCTVSIGGFGGVRLREAMLSVFVELGLIPCKSSVTFGQVKTLFDSEGKILDDSYGEKMKKMLDEIAWYTTNTKQKSMV